jgi:hypothetical protein
MPLRVVVIVEGHGEDEAIRGLLERIWYEYLGGDFIQIEPWRSKQSKILNPASLAEIIQAAESRLHDTLRNDFQLLILMMTDTDGKPENCPKELSVNLIEWARKACSRTQTQLGCVLPNVEFETWFVAGADSLRGFNGFPEDLVKPTEPEKKKLGKKWVKRNLAEKYIETRDQPRFVSKLDIAECYAASRSFKKLVDELQKRLPAPPAAE